MFVDVSGSTRLYEIAGDEVAAAAMNNCIDLFKRETEAAKGRVIKTIGDEVMAVFPSATSAAEAAIAMQNGIAGMDEVAGTTLGIRIGFQFGQMVERDNDVFGDTVNLAARLAGLATKGQIITSRQSAAELTPILQSSCRRLYEIQVKGKAQEVEICEVPWRQNEEDSTFMAARSVAKPKNAALRLRYREIEIVLSHKRNSVSLGRDKSADLVILEKTASRIHGKIERRLDKFVLVDHSANGTFVTIKGEPEIQLRREEVVLRGDGQIAFGQSCTKTKELVEFSYE